MFAVASWLFGIDVLYALQDEHFDRRHGLRSVPSRFGTRRAMHFARLAHGGMIGCLLGSARLLGCGPVFLVGVALIAAILLLEHRLVRAAHGSADLTKIPKAFFDCNAYVSAAFFVTTLVDGVLRP